MIVPVRLHVSGNEGANAPSLQPAPTSLKFTGIAGTDTAPQYVLVASSGTALKFTAAVQSDFGWLNIDQWSGTTPLAIKVTASSAVPGGMYTGSLVLTDLDTGDQSSVNITYNLAARVLTATPALLTFTQQTAGVALAPQQVQVTANAPSTFRIASQPAWIKITPAAALATPANLTVSVNPTGMAPGQYADRILLSGPNDVQIQVSLTLAAPAPPGVTPSSLSFSYELGSPPPQSQTIRISCADRTVPYTAAVSTVSGLKWLAISSSSGTTPGSVAVSLNGAQLVPGPQSGAVTLTFQDGASTIVTVPVTLTVTGSPIQVQSVLNAATLAPTSLAPGEIVTLSGYGFGPETPVVAHPTSAGAYATQLAGATVLFDQTPAPLLMVQDEQINAIVPYAVYGRTSAKIQVQNGTSYSIPIEVKVVDTAPGIFTNAGSGKWQAAALNADLSPNSTLNPAQRGSVIVLYLTGEGQTDPPGQDGRVIASDLRIPLSPVTAQIGGHTADVLYAGSAPGMVSGVCQVNLRIPDSIDPGTQPVEIQVGGTPSQRGVTIEVR